jgi:cytochrome c oxidase assembly factor CtaG
MSTDVTKQLQQSAKLGFDYFKHLTTLSTGSIVFLGSVLEKLFSEPAWKPLVYISFAGFVICVVASVFAMLSFCHLTTPTVSGQAQPSENNLADQILGGSSGIAAISFVLAILLLTVFFIRNL